MEKFLNRIVWLLMIVPVIYLAIVWNTLPEKVAVHFDINGKPDRFGSKPELLLMVIILSIMCPVSYLILSNIYRIDPKKYAAENKFRLRRLAFGVVVFMVAVLCMIIYSSSKGNISFNTGIILAATGLLFAFIGNYMHNIKPNYFAGFRLPWALENEENWKRTHALAGKLWFGGGLFLAVTCLFLSPRMAMAVFITVMIIITAIPILFSFHFYRKHKKITINK
ncbi:MAG: SdpI family protein [Chitinophagaceae bacterium]|nr:SdpI family protein [Chitinophagaceae bacterium]MBK8953695.1 SdpI family protein [Chitinophagaceae bacterium]